MTTDSTPRDEATQQQAQARRHALKIERARLLEQLPLTEQERDEILAEIEAIKYDLETIEIELNALPKESEQP